MSSILVKKQEKKMETRWEENGSTMRLVATIRHDDCCGNGHNSFAITGELYDSSQRREGGLISCGCLHDEILKRFPQLAVYLKWHLCSTDEPMHYIANTLYHIDCWKLDWAKKSAIWANMPSSFFYLNKRVKTIVLLERLPELMAEFKQDVETLGLVW